MDHRKRQQTPAPNSQRTQQLVGQASIWNYPIPPPELFSQFPESIQQVFTTEL